jgi:hypothetical protein
MATLKVMILSGLPWRVCLITPLKYSTPVRFVPTIHHSQHQLRALSVYADTPKTTRLESVKTDGVCAPETILAHPTGVTGKISQLRTDDLPLLLLYRLLPHPPPRQRRHYKWMTTVGLKLLAPPRIPLKYNTTGQSEAMPTSSPPPTFVMLQAVCTASLMRHCLARTAGV